MSTDTSIHASRLRNVLPTLALVGLIVASPTLALGRQFESGRIEGIVQNADSLSPGMTVTIVDLSRTTTTEADGTFAFEDVPDGEHFLKVESQFDFGDLKFVTVAGDTQNVSIRRVFSTLPQRVCGPFPQVGTVRDVEGRPVAGATVWSFDGHESIETGPDGTYRLDQIVAGSNVTVARSSDRWGFSGGPDIRLDRRAAAPAPPIVVLDLVERAPQAQWTNGKTNLTWAAAAAGQESVDYADLALGSRLFRFAEDAPQRMLQTRLAARPLDEVRGLFAQSVVASAEDVLVARLAAVQQASTSPAVGITGRHWVTVTFVEPDGTPTTLVDVDAKPAPNHQADCTSTFSASFPPELDGKTGKLELAVISARSGRTELGRPDDIVLTRAQLWRRR